MEKNLTQGNAFRTLLQFSLPFLLSYFLQTLYGMADLFIVGQFDGVASTTAVSVGSQVMHMITVMIVGLAMGSTVMIGRSVGARRLDEASAAIGNTVTMFMGLSVFATVLLLFLVKPIVAVMATPAEAVGGTIDYLTVCIIGIPFITAYNIICSIFRGLGDSKSPMHFIAIACAANIFLDYLFIGYMGLGPVGAALGTTSSQALSVIISLFIVFKRKTGITLGRQQFRPKKSLIHELLKIGLPVAFQDGFIQISFIVITIIANMRGLNDAAAVGIVEKVISFLFLVPSSMLQSVSALDAQNVGAGKHDRAKLTLKYAIMICVSFGILVVIMTQLEADNIVGLFTSDDTVIHMGGQYMRGYILDCIFAGIHFCFSGYFCAYGLSGYSFMHNAISIVWARIPLAYLASISFPDTLLPMGLATAAGSLVSVAICIALYLNIQKKAPKRLTS